MTQVLSPIFEEQFSENSFSFQPNRGAHDALKQCQTNVNDGQVISLIYKYLNAGVISKGDVRKDRSWYATGQTTKPTSKQHHAE